MAFLESMWKQAVNVNKSIGDLTQGEKYRIRSMDEMQTKFRLAIACRLEDVSTGGTINVFLPGYIKITDEEARQ